MKKEEKKKDDDWEMSPIIVLIALICAIASVVFVHDTPDDPIGIILLYTVFPFVLTIIYTFLIHLILGIILVIIYIPYFIIKDIFSKNK